jgi:UDP-N-acetylmuramate: L-alanyl-gamma-D-glutamyl-meso-diaminopimelate ligase
MEKIHFIGIGGSAMHSLAIALKKSGYKVSGSDKEIYDPSKNRLERHGLHPQNIGWFPENITEELDAVILGLHSENTNPELLRAQELGLKVYCYPEFMYHINRGKKRVVIAGSHGKTTITVMVMHVLNFYGIKYNYLVGAPLEGSNSNAQITDDASIFIVEGDEYPSSPIDRRPKFVHYQPDIALISGIAWDHVNHYPNFSDYTDQFRNFINSIKIGGKLVYYENDEVVDKLAHDTKMPIMKIPYSTHGYELFDNKSFLKIPGGRLPLHIIGDHNMQNISGAKAICMELGISSEKFYNGIKYFKGASMRMQLLGKSDSVAIYLDYAQAPSKLKASVQSAKKQFPGRKLVACMELHAIDSLQENYLEQYRDTMLSADVAIVYYDPALLASYGLTGITPEKVRRAFSTDRLIQVYTETDKMLDRLYSLVWDNANLLLMTTGNFSGIAFNKIAERILEKNKSLVTTSSGIFTK